MKIDRLVLTAFSPAFPGVVDLNLRELEPGLIAVVGANGAGKTTLLEAAAGAIYRQMPSADGADPVSYATSRESSLVLEYELGEDAYRSTLHLDGPKRQTDALLEHRIDADTLVPVNDGKRSTYDEVVKSYFPSFDLFINSSFAAQGRGDEFTRRKPSQRKDLFAEFLGQQHYGVMATSAGAAADLCEDSRLRLTVQIETLERDTAAGVQTALEQLTQELQRDGGAAELRKQALAGTLADLETKSALAADQVAAYAAATDRVGRLANDLQDRRRDREAVTTERARVVADHMSDTARITSKRDTDVRAAGSSIAKNEQVLEQAAAIRAAARALTQITEQLAALRTRLEAEQQDQQRVLLEDAGVARQEATARTAKAALDGAQRDSAILATVPCAGAGPYAACQFLKNATVAHAQIPTHAAAASPLADLEASRTRYREAYERAKGTVTGTTREIAALEATLTEKRKLADYETPLAAAEARITELTEVQRKAEQDAADQLTAASARLGMRLTDLDARARTLDEKIADLETELAPARSHLAFTADSNQQAVLLQTDLRRLRAEWDIVIAHLATVESGRRELDRRRQELASKLARLTDVRGRKTRVDQELIEWRDLQKAFAKGGLPDLEIDAAGPTISATTNAILQDCFGPRFTVELVTQVANASGGLKDEFTVQVIDNEQPGAEWRDIRKFSGGQKTILQEALMCAIALYVNERSPMPIRTLWRDETGAALDGENALRYVAMLRKVRELGQFHHVFFITHNPDAALAADAQIRVGDGTARIVLPPFQEAA